LLIKTLLLQWSGTFNEEQDAFDTITHRLERVIEIKGTALGWFKSYLSGRFQFALVNEESSSHQSKCVLSNTSWSRRMAALPESGSDGVVSLHSHACSGREIGLKRSFGAICW